jgi:hypothetical protein
MMETILIHWDQPRPWTIYYGSKEDKKQGREVPISVMLRPGIQTVSMEQWKEIEKHPRVIRALDEGTLKIEKSVKKEGGEPEALADVPKSLKGKSIKDAIHFVSGVMDETLLKKYRSLENRPAVKKALETQIDKLKKATKESKE